MSICSCIVKKVCPLPKIEDFDRYLFVGPHPDDIEVGAGATVAKLSAEGKKICFLICTDGRYGFENLKDGTTPDKLIEIRKNEALKSAEMLGVNDVRFLGLSDGGYYKLEQLNQGIIDTVADFQPDIILSPDPCVNNECHTDHLNVGQAVRQIAFFAHHDAIMKNHNSNGAPVKAVAFFMTSSFNTFVNTSGYLERQLDALFKAHVSQYPSGCDDEKAIRSYIKLRSKTNGLKKLCKDAEGFRILGVTHMHCLPEISE